jgi:hypothetical protein
MTTFISKKSIQKYSCANSLLLVTAIAVGFGLFSSAPLQAMVPKKHKKHAARQQLFPSVDQFSLVVQMGIWDQALTILENTNTKKAKASYLLGDYAQDEEEESNLHLAALRAPIEVLKKLVEHAHNCNIDLPNLFWYTQNEDGWPLKLSILDVAHSREEGKESAIYYLNKEIFPA